MGAVTVLRRPFLCGNCAGIFAVTACLAEANFSVSGGGSLMSSVFEGGSGAGGGGFWRSRQRLTTGVIPFCPRPRFKKMDDC